MNLAGGRSVIEGMKRLLFAALCCTCGVCAAAGSAPQTEERADLGTVTVEGSALSKYRSESVSGGTFTDVPPEKLPTVVDSLTEDFIQEHNPTDLHDLLRYVPGIETGGKSLLIRQPGTFTIRGMAARSLRLTGSFRSAVDRGFSWILSSWNA